MIRRTKIVATIGPAADARGVLAGMLAAGIDVARLNSAHGTPDDLARRLAAVRAAAEAAGRVVGVLLDLQGPKLRVGDMGPGVTLTDGAAFRLVAGQCVGSRDHACLTYDGLAADVSPGDSILVDDGALELVVTRLEGADVVTRVVRGGALGAHKGVNVPGVRLSVDGVTPRDLETLRWGLDAGVDLVAQSFVRSADDVARLRAAMGDRRVPIVAKIEKHEALADLGAIVEAADAVMVARGDLAVETSPEAVPPAQRRIIETCRARGRAVIVATQMLESMTSSPRPTRAEASDVATAVFEGADAVMLSEETAVGDYPVVAVETMDRVCRSAEGSGPGALGEPVSPDPTSPVAAAAVDLARDTGAAAIVTATKSGGTARAVAALRPAVPIIALAADPEVARVLALTWGVMPVVAGPTSSVEDTTRQAAAAALATGLVGPGDHVVMTAGTAVGVAGSSDLVRVLTL